MPEKISQGPVGKLDEEPAVLELCALNRGDEMRMSQAQLVGPASKAFQDEPQLLFSEVEPDHLQASVRIACLGQDCGGRISTVGSKSISIVSFPVSTISSTGWTAREKEEAANL